MLLVLTGAVVLRPSALGDFSLHFFTFRGKQYCFPLCLISGKLGDAVALPLSDLFPDLGR